MPQGFRTNVVYLPPTTVAAIKAQTATRAKSLFTVKAISAIRKSLRQEGTDDKDTGLKQQQSKGAMEMESRWSEMERDGARWGEMECADGKRREEKRRRGEGRRRRRYKSGAPATSSGCFVWAGATTRLPMRKPRPGTLRYKGLRLRHPGGTRL